ncbi:MAG: ABC transporter ATP-binding protein [Lachnospiraceae bacterium]|nr:ABC transporter ATP-binding protein [Candidatus Merdinaster equi]
MKLLLEVFKKNIKYVIPLILFTIVGIVFRLINTSFIGTVVNQVMAFTSDPNASETAGSVLSVIGLEMFGICAMISVMGIMSIFFASKLSAVTGRDLRKKLFTKIMSFSMKEIDSLSVSSLITLCTNDIVQIQNVVFIICTTALQVPFLVIGGITSMVANRSGLSWTVALASGLVIVILLVCVLRTLKIAGSYQGKIDAINSVTREGLTGTQVIRAFNRDTWNEERIIKASKEFRDINISFTRKMIVMEPSVYLVLNLVNLLATWLGAKRLEEGLINVGVISSYTSYLFMIVMGVLMFGLSAFSMIRMIVSLKRIRKIMDIEPAVSDGDLPKESIPERQSIEFKNVSFKYDEEGGYVIKNIDFTAECGKTTAIIGNTGCGKSTIMNLVSRLYDPDEGEILIGGIDARRYPVNELRNQIGYVTQKAVLFTGDIKSNIDFGTDCSDEAISEAAEIAQIKEFVDDNEEGYGYAIARGGTNVSGGQRQRLSIARAIAKNPKIYLFDDSFSALDYKTDAKLRKALKEKTKDATVLIVAQRVTSILDADRIIVMHNGIIVGQGTSSELLKSCEYYREILKSQVSEDEYEKMINNES